MPRIPGRVPGPLPAARSRLGPGPVESRLVKPPARRTRLLAKFSSDRGCPFSVTAESGSGPQGVGGLCRRARVEGAVSSGPNQGHSDPVDRASTTRATRLPGGPRPAANKEPQRRPRGRRAVGWQAGLAVTIRGIRGCGGSGEPRESGGGGAGQPRGGGAGLTGPRRPMVATEGQAGREPPLKGRCDRESGPGAGGRAGARAGGRAGGRETGRETGGGGRRAGEERGKGGDKQ